MQSESEMRPRAVLMRAVGCRGRGTRRLAHLVPGRGSRGLLGLLWLLTRRLQWGCRPWPFWASSSCGALRSGVGTRVSAVEEGGRELLTADALSFWQRRAFPWLWRPPLRGRALRGGRRGAVGGLTGGRGGGEVGGGRRGLEIEVWTQRRYPAVPGGFAEIA